PIDYFPRVGGSHVRYWRDSLRTLQIIVENILYYNPLKLFLLAVNALVVIAALSVLGLFLLPDGAHSLLPILAATSIPSAFIVGALALSAALQRVLQRRRIPEDDRPSEVQRPRRL